MAIFLCMNKIHTCTIAAPHLWPLDSIHAGIVASALFASLKPLRKTLLIHLFMAFAGFKQNPTAFSSSCLFARTEIENDAHSREDYIYYFSYITIIQGSLA